MNVPVVSELPVALPASVRIIPLEELAVSVNVPIFCVTAVALEALPETISVLFPSVTGVALARTFGVAGVMFNLTVPDDTVRAPVPELLPEITRSPPGELIVMPPVPVLLPARIKVPPGAFIVVRPL